LVYNIAFSSFKNTPIIADDSNVSISLGDHDEDAHITYSKYEPWGTKYSFVAGEPALGVAEPKERKRSSTGGMH